MATDAQRIREAAAKYGHTVDSIAQRYVNPLTGERLSGEALLLKTAQGESNALTSPKARTAVSSAGARAWAQFTPGTRASFIKEFGIDAWRSPDEAIHAMSLHLRGKGGHPTGLEGYNPGDPSYPSYILGQKVGAPTARASGGGGGTLAAGLADTTAAPASGTGQSFSPGAVQALLAEIQPAAAAPASAPAAPVFTAGPVAPKMGSGLVVPSSGVPSPPADSLGAKLAGISAMGGDPNADFSADPAAAPTSQTPTTGGAGGGYSGRTPTGKRGKVIGVPYQGTHNLGNWQSDNAVDIAVPEGTPMVALQDVVVLKVTKHPQGAGRFAGDQITVRGANGNEYFYAHGKAAVKVGEKVPKGGSLGTTGSANGVAHLHFGQMKGDPRKHT